MIHKKNNNKNNNNNNNNNQGVFLELLVAAKNCIHQMVNITELRIIFINKIASCISIFCEIKIANICITNSYIHIL